MLAERDKLNADIHDVLDKHTEGWGIKVSTVELKRIDLDESIVREIARQAEAERKRRAKIINAEGEQQAAQKLVEAARILAAVPQAMQLRYLGTLFDISSERRSTIVFPVPIELVHASAAMAQELTSARSTILAEFARQRESRTARIQGPRFARGRAEMTAPLARRLRFLRSRLQSGPGNPTPAAHSTPQ